MAWSWVGIAPAAASAPVESTTTSIALYEPAGVQANDLLVVVISYRAVGTASVVLPAGWLLVEEQKTSDITEAGTGSIASGVMAYTVRSGSAGGGSSSPFTADFSADFGAGPSPFTADFSADFGTGAAPLPSYVFTLPIGISVALGRMVAYRNTNVPRLGTHVSTTLAVAATAVVATGLATTLANDLVVVGMCGARNITNTTFDAATDPTTTSGTGSAQAAAPIVGTWQERADDGTGTGADCGLAIADAVRGTAGTTGNITCTASASARHAVLVASFVNVTTSFYNIHQGLAAWATGNKTLGQRVSNAGNAYECITIGTSTVAPTGTASDSAPGGTAHWKWLSAIDYTSSTAWRNAMPATLVSDLTATHWNHGEVVLATGRALEFWGRTTGIFRVMITVAPGDSLRDKPNSALTYNPANGLAFRQTSGNTDFSAYTDTPNVTFDGFQFKNENSTTGVQMMLMGADNVTISNMLIDGYPRIGDIELVYAPGRNFVQDNVVIIDRQPAGIAQAEPIKIDLNPATAIIKNSTIISVNGASPNGVAIKALGSAGQCIVRNVAIFGYPLPFLDQNAAGSNVFDHCIMDVPVSATQAGTVSFGSVNAGGNLFSRVAANQFVSPTSDLRLKTGADAIHAGVGDPASLDLYRVARGALPDIGPAQFVSTVIVGSLVALGMAGSSARAGLAPISIVSARGTSGGFAAMQTGIPPGALSAIGMSAASGRLSLNALVGLQVRGTGGGSAQGSVSGGLPQVGLIARGTAGSSASMGLFGQSIIIGGTGVAGGRGMMGLTVGVGIAARGTAGGSARGSGIGSQRVGSIGIATGTATVIGLGASTVAETLASILSRLSPDFNMEEKPRLLVAPFGDGYQQVTPDGLTAIQRTLTLGWQDTDRAEIDRLVGFFRNHVGKVMSFVAPRETTPRQWIVISMHRGFPQPNGDSLTVTLEERLFVDKSLIPGAAGFDVIGEGELV